VRRFIFLFLVLAGTAWAQETSTANAAQQDPPDEIGKLRKNCPFTHLLGCAEVLFTGQPLHIAVGSIAPQNGFGAGLAYVGHHDTDNWSTSWSADAVASNNASWRTGIYVKFVDTHLKPARPELGTENADASDVPVYTEQPVFNLYAQSISLNKLTFFGLGPSTTTSGRSFYGMTEHIFGGNAIRPIYERLNVGFYGEINGRAVNIRPSTGQPSPSIGQIYTPETAPGLANQPFFVQLGVGLRMRPSAFHNHLHFNYDVAYRPYFAVSDSSFSFQRLTVDLYQEYSIYHTNMRVPRDTNGPNDCLIDSAVEHPRCPKVTMRSREGKFGLRVRTELSMTPGGDTVPFYFQPTLGGADINGNPWLPSFQDYRFRAPNVILLRQNFEHTIWGPLGFALSADEGKVALNRGDLGPNPWIRSYSTGLTLRAGGFPQVFLLFSWGGNEGTHTIANVNTSLLGVSSRPSLY